MKKALSLLVAVAVMATAASAFAAATMAASKHNMTSYVAAGNSTGSNKEVCVFCHTPHNAIKNRALWNRNDTVATFKLYTGGANDEAADWYLSGNKTTMAAGNVSLMCLSCHDGATNIATQVRNKKGTITLTNDVMVATISSTLGTDLSNDHPINVNYETIKTALTGKFAEQTDFATRKSAAGTAVKIISGGVECASCHDVHNTTYSPFLRDTMAGSVLCLQCHTK